MAGDGGRGDRPQAALVFVDEMGVHTSLASLYGYSPEGERVRLKVPRNLKAGTRRFWRR